MLKNAEDSDACIFLDQETNHCTVYGARPLQCATYPWWPELVQSRKAWAQEARQVCEGILLDDHDDDDVELVSSREAAAHLDAFCAYLASSSKENNIDDATRNNDNSGIK
jgi:Fe-S-cluster containining protein